MPSIGCEWCFTNYVLLHLIQWPTACKWHSPHLSGNFITFHPMTNSLWVTLPPLFRKAISSHFITWPTASEWHSTRFPGNFITFHPMTNSKWVTLLFSARQCHHISSYEQQLVSDTPSFFLQGNLITFHPMTNSKWVTLPPFFCETISSHFIPWPTASEWHGLLFPASQSHHISSHDQQQVSDTPSCFLQGNLTTFHPMTNSKWVTLPPFFFQAISSHFIPWPTASEWHSILCSARQSHHISSHDQQQVSDTPSFFLQGNLITFHPMTNSLWVTLPSFFCKAISSHFIPMTNRMWVTLPPFSARQSHHISSHDQ